jgi:hypothetical protein
MAQRDYILRMIEQMGQVLIRLRRMLAGQGAGRDVLRGEIDSAATLYGINPTLLREATHESLAMLLSPTVDPSRCWLGAELLFLDATSAEAAGRPEEARAAYRRADLLYRLIEPAGVMLTGWPEARERIEDIHARLSRLEQNSDSRSR